MSEQSYATHAHTPVPTLIATAFWLLIVVGLVASRLGHAWGGTLAWAGVLLCLAVLVSIGRMYTTRLQDRIIRLEERLRVASLLTLEQQARFAQLTPKQVAALRFACDQELGPLLDRTVAERLTPDAIKRAVTQWRPDHHRT